MKNIHSISQNVLCFEVEKEMFEFESLMRLMQDTRDNAKHLNDEERKNRAENVALRLMDYMQLAGGEPEEDEVAEAIEGEEQMRLVGEDESKVNEEHMTNTIEIEENLDENTVTETSI